MGPYKHNTFKIKTVFMHDSSFDEFLLLSIPNYNGNLFFNVICGYDVILDNHVQWIAKTVDEDNNTITEKNMSAGLSKNLGIGYCYNVKKVRIMSGE